MRSSTDLTWELVRNEKSQAPFQASCLRTCTLNGDSPAHHNLRSAALKMPPQSYSLPRLLWKLPSLASAPDVCLVSSPQTKYFVKHSQEPWGPRGKTVPPRHFINQTNAWRVMVHTCKPQGYLDLVPLQQPEQLWGGKCLTTSLGWSPDL